VKDKRPIVLLASTLTLALALPQGTLAQTEAGAAAPASAQAAEATTAPAQAPTPAPAPSQAAGAEAAAEGEPGAQPAKQPEAPVQPEAAAMPEPATAPQSAPAAAGEKMEERHAEMMEERRKRYEDLRERAASVGLILPETPPWETSAMTPPEMPKPPAMPAMPERPGAGRAPTPEERQAMREARYEAMRKRAAESGVELPETPPWKLMTPEEREARREMMRSMTPEQRAAMREAHWAEMRERAAEEGIELPDAPPWKMMQQQRDEMRAKWESYRALVEQMTEEEREAAAAVFGRGPAARRQPMPPQMPVQPGYGGDLGPMPAMPRQAPYPGMMPGQGRGPAAPWGGGNAPMMQMPSPKAGHGPGW
jgi:hypothetical protein